MLHDWLQKHDWRQRHPTGLGGSGYLRGTKRESQRGGWGNAGRRPTCSRARTARLAGRAPGERGRCWGPGGPVTAARRRAGDPADAVGVARGSPVSVELGLPRWLKPGLAGRAGWGRASGVETGRRD